MIYLVIVNYYSAQFVTRLVRSIQEYTDVPYQIVIVNNSSDDREIYELSSSSIILEAGTNLGFGCACNLGLNWIYERDPKTVVWLINPDTYLSNNALKQTKLLFEANPELSIVGTTVYTPTGEIWFSSGSFNPKTGAIVPQKTPLNDIDYEVSDWVTGCSLLVNLKSFPDCPQFEPSYFLYYEDFDFCRRYYLQGHSVVVTPRIHIFHQPSSITSTNIFAKLKYSTFSYLLTLEKYTNHSVLLLRLVRIVFNSFFLFSLRPREAAGKLAGVSLYLKKRLKSYL